MTRGNGENSPIEIELCGRLADGLGRTVTLAVPRDGLTASALLGLAAKAFSALAAPIAAGRVKVCANDAIVAGNHVVGPGDRVALFPPVSGG